MKTLDLINKVIRNVVREGKEPKYRKLRLSNKLISAKIVNVDGALDALFGKQMVISLFMRWSWFEECAPQCFLVCR